MKILFSIVMYERFRLMAVDTVNSNSNLFIISPALVIEGKERSLLRYASPEVIFVNFKRISTRGRRSHRCLRVYVLVGLQ